MNRFVLRRSGGAALAPIVLTALLSMPGAPAAQGEDVNARLARQWGLIGTWRTDCNAPISVRSGALSYVIRNGRLYHDRNFGTTRDFYPVARVRLLRNGLLVLTMRFTRFRRPETRQFGFLKDRSGRKRAWYNWNMTTNRIVIAKGRFVRNGRRIAWLYRCR